MPTLLRGLKAWRNGGGVQAFEAQERIYYALCGNIAINNCFNASAKLAALGNPSKANEKLKIPKPNYNQNSSFGSLELIKSDKNEFIGQKIDYDDCAEVDLISIDSLEFSRIDFIKLDVESMEMPVLLGALGSIKRFLPTMMIEIIKSDKAQISEFLKDLGYEIFAFGINILAVHKSDELISKIKKA